VSKIIKAFKAIFDTLLVVILLCTLSLFLLPKLMGANLLVVLSQSMEPTLPMGSIVVSRPIANNGISYGDVITFHSHSQSGTSLVTHRVVGKVGQGIMTRYRTQGDAVDTPDLAPVSLSNVVGKAWFAIPMAGYLIAFVRTPPGFIALITLPALLLIISEVVEAFRQGSQSKETTQQRVLTLGDERK
jgi:signal peptidase